MASGYELAKAYVQIIPTTENIKSNLSSALNGDAEKAGDEAGQKSGGKFSSAFGKAAAAIGATVATVAAAVGAVTKEFVSAVNGVAEYGDEIDKTSQKVGVSAEQYQVLAFAAEHCGFETSVLQTAAKSLANTDFTGNMADALSYVMSLGTEEERTAAAMELFGARATQQMAALLNGDQSIEDYQVQLESLGGIMSNDSVKAAAAFEDSVTDMQTSLTGLKNNMISQFLPACTSVTDGLTSIFSGDTEKGLAQIKEGIAQIGEQLDTILPVVIEVGGNIIVALAQALVENLDPILTAALSVVEAVANALPTILPTILMAIVNLIVQICSNLSQILEPIISMLPQMITMILDALASNIGAIVSGIVQCVIMILDHLPEIISALVQGIPQVIVGLITAIVQNLPTLIVAIVKCIGEIAIEIGKSLGNIWSDTIWPWLSGIISGIGDWFSNLFSSIGDFFVQLAVDFVNWQNETKQKIADFFSNIISSVVDFVSQIPQKIAEGFSAVWEAGKNLVQGLWNGISDAAQWVLDKIKGFGQTILNGIKSIFGIASPSKEMAWVGEMLGAGLAVGIEDSTKDAVQSATAMTSSVLDAVAMDGAGLIGTDINGTFTANATATQTGRVGATGPITMNIYGAEGQNVEDLADAVIDRLQRVIIGSEAVYA